MLDLTDAAISQPVQGEAKIPSLQAGTYLLSLRHKERLEQGCPSRAVQGVCFAALAEDR